MPSPAAGLPELRIASNPLSPEAVAGLLGAGPRLALVFAAEAPLLQSTVHQLQVDAHACAGHRSSHSVAVLGGHADWRTPDCRHARCALLVDPDGLVSQYSFERPVPIDVAWTLHLPLDGEQELHASISADCDRAGLPQINPYPASERADDKLRAHRLWATYLAHGRDEFALPAATLIARGASEADVLSEIKRFLARVGLPSTLIVQPSRGTEGQSVAAARIDRGEAATLESRRPLVRHICEAILPSDDALVREERGNVRVNRSAGRALHRAPPMPGGTGCLSLSEAGPRTGSTRECAELRRVAFRVNVAWNGAEFVAESGFAQVAGSEGSVLASRGREGAIADINECFAQLHYRCAGGWRRFVASEADIEALRRAAAVAAWALNADLQEEEYLKHMGIDMVLEVDAESGKMTPVVLEANARPAGLNQAMALRGIAPGPSRLHVSTALFHFIARRVSRCPSRTG